MDFHIRQTKYWFQDRRAVMSKKEVESYNREFWYFISIMKVCEMLISHSVELGWLGGINKGRN